MSKLFALKQVMALSLASALSLGTVAAQNAADKAADKQEARAHPLPSTKHTEGTAADSTLPGHTGTRGEVGVGTGVNPAPRRARWKEPPPIRHRPVKHRRT